MLFRKLWLSLCAGALLAAHPLQAEEPTQLREVRVAYIGILPSETTEHAVYPTFDFLDQIRIGLNTLIDLWYIRIRIFL